MDKPTCRWPECERPATTKGFCPRDYQRAKREGTYDTPWVTWARVRATFIKCRWPECERTDNEGRGLCQPHWRRAKVVSDWDEPWTSWEAARRPCRECSEPI